MTEERMRIVTAEICGWIFPLSKEWAASEWHARKLGDSNGTFDSIVPDYPNDLNATGKALKTMTAAQWMMFGERLLDALGHDEDCYEGWNLHSAVVGEILTTPIPKLLEIFLRTHNKWEES